MAICVAYAAAASSTHSREILPADAACLRLQFESGHMDLRIAARDGLALLLNEHDDTLRVSIAGTLLSDFLGAFVPLGLGVAEVVAFQRDAEAGDALGFGMTLGDIDAVPLTASPSLLAALQAAITGLASPVQLPAWLASLRVTTRLRIGKRHRVGSATAIAAAGRCFAARHHLGSDT